MSFAAPLWLAALALVPLALAARCVARRRRSRYAVRFPAFATLHARRASRRSGGGTRPAVLALAALAALVVALARPHVNYRVPVGPGVGDARQRRVRLDGLDRRAADAGCGAAERAANTFIDELPSTVRVGAIAFSSRGQRRLRRRQADHAAARDVIDGQQANGGTATGNALALALQMLDGASAEHPPAAIVLLSDGAANEGIPVLTVAREAARERIPIDTVALGTPDGTLADPEAPGLPVAVPPDPQLMAQIAQLSGGRSFDAQTADELSSIYTNLGLRLGTVRAQARDHRRVRDRRARPPAARRCSPRRAGRSGCPSRAGRWSEPARRRLRARRRVQLGRVWQQDEQAADVSSWLKVIRAFIGPCSNISGTSTTR